MTQEKNMKRDAYLTEIRDTLTDLMNELITSFRRWNGGYAQALGNLRDSISYDEHTKSENMPMTVSSPQSKAGTPFSCVTSMTAWLIQSYHKMCAMPGVIPDDAMLEHDTWFRNLRRVQNEGIDAFVCRGNVQDGFTLVHKSELEGL